MAENNQADQRRWQPKTDQHGRLWGGSIETKSGDWCGLVDYIEDARRDDPTPSLYPFRPPWLPPVQYLAPMKNRPNECFIRYDALLGEIRLRNQDYNRKALEEGLRLYGEKYDPEAPITRAVRSIIGPPPLSQEIVLAAKMGNPWILGMTKDPDPRLAHFFVPRAKLGNLEPMHDYSKPYTMEDAKRDALAELQRQQEAPVQLVGNEAGGLNDFQTFDCTQCDKTFATQRALDGHMASHTRAKAGV